MYWQVFSAKTKAEREAERAAKEVEVAATKPKARIVM
jgi:phage antirepressor YoqD-like protein